MAASLAKVDIGVNYESLMKYCETFMFGPTATAMKHETNTLDLQISPLHIVSGNISQPISMIEDTHRTISHDSTTQGASFATSSTVNDKSTTAVTFTGSGLHDNSNNNTTTTGASSFTQQDKDDGDDNNQRHINNSGPLSNLHTSANTATSPEALQTTAVVNTTSTEAMQTTAVVNTTSTDRINNEALHHANQKPPHVRTVIALLLCRMVLPPISVLLYIQVFTALGWLGFPEDKLVRLVVILESSAPPAQIIVVSLNQLDLPVIAGRMAYLYIYAYTLSILTITFWTTIGIYTIY